MLLKRLVKPVTQLEPLEQPVRDRKAPCRPLAMSGMRSAVVNSNNVDVWREYGLHFSKELDTKG